MPPPHPKPSSRTSYWSYLLFQFTVPTFLDAWRQLISASPYNPFLLTLHRSFKFIYKCICRIFNSSRTNASEIGRALQIAHASRVTTIDSAYQDHGPELTTDDQRGCVEEERVEKDQVSDGLAVWRIDWALRHSKTLSNVKVTLDTGLTDVEDVALAIMSLKSIDLVLSPTLVICLNRIRAANQYKKNILERANTPYNSETDEPRLKELWKLLKPDKTFESIHSKSWQEIGFQGSDPATDFRGSASLGLDALIFFGKRYGKVAQEIVSEAVDGGPSWYPWALASINITYWCINLLKQNKLQHFILHLPTTSNQDNTFLILQTQLCILFHSYWRRIEPCPSVMEFEEKFKIFKFVVCKGLEKGLVGGIGVGWIEEVEPPVIRS